MCHKNLKWQRHVGAMTIYIQHSFCQWSKFSHTLIRQTHTRNNTYIANFHNNVYNVYPLLFQCRQNVCVFMVSFALMIRFCSQQPECYVFFMKYYYLGRMEKDTQVYLLYIDLRVIECYCLLKYLNTIEDIVTSSSCVCMFK